jgi:hypothetical protein
LSTVGIFRTSLVRIRAPLHAMDIQRRIYMCAQYLAMLGSSKLAVLSPFGASSSGKGDGPRDQNILTFVDCATLKVCSARSLHAAAFIELASLWRCVSCWMTCLVLLPSVPNSKDKRV